MRASVIGARAYISNLRQGNAHLWKSDRVERDVGIMENVPLELIKDAIERPFEMANAFELLNKCKTENKVGTSNISTYSSTMWHIRW